MKITVSCAFFALALGTTAIGCGNEAAPLDEAAISQASHTTSSGSVTIYEGGHSVAQNQLSPLNAADFGITPIGCHIDLRGRIDLNEGSLFGGVFQATEGRYRVVFPGATHTTIIDGRVTAQIGGQTYRLAKGDSFLATKGTTVIFETTSSRHQTSFFTDFTSDASQPGLFKVYPENSAPNEADLISLGTPADFNMTVLSGNPTLMARIDYAVGLESAGHFRITKSKLYVNPVSITEHGSVTKYGMTMTDTTNGNVYKLNMGDSYLVRQGAVLIWEVKTPAVFQSFYGVFVPH